VLQPGSTLAVPDGTGIGVVMQRDRLSEAEARWQEANQYV
jgi:hypothetical protein